MTKSLVYLSASIVERPGAYWVEAHRGFNGSGESFGPFWTKEAATKKFHEIRTMRNT